MNRPVVRYSAYFILASILACNTNSHSSNDTTNDTLKKVTATPDTTKTVAPIITENDIMDTLNALPFVKESSKIIDSVSHHKHGMAFIIDTAEKEYAVKAGYDRDDRFETFYTFTVDKKTRAIKVLDVVTDEMISPEEFEKRKMNNQ